MKRFIIKDIRKNKKITLKQLSEITGLSTSYLSAIENNKVKDPNFKTIAKIAAGLGKKVENLFIDSNQMVDLREELYKSIEKNGIEDERTQIISSKIDEMSIDIMKHK